MILVTIKGELTDLNTYIKYLNSSRWGGNELKQSETNRVVKEVKFQKVQPITEYPVQIKYKWYSPDRRKDLDNVSFSKKFINDGLVVGGVLQDDSRKFISGFSDEFYIDKENPRVEVEISTAI